jgi:hypothetical protein
MIILEVFLTPGGTEPITKSISESIARILLAGLNKRKALKDDVKNFKKKKCYCPWKKEGYAQCRRWLVN